MPVNEDTKPQQDDPEAPEPSEESTGEVSPPPGESVSAGTDAEAPSGDEERHDVAPVGGVASPSQLGAQRYVYASYFFGAITVAFFVSKALELVWLKIQSYKPVVGEPRDEIVMPISALAGALVAFYYWYRTRARQLAEEVAAEMSKVTWPTRDEVTNGTFVVIVTTIVSTVFFALMDKFWGFVTNLVYGGT